VAPGNRRSSECEEAETPRRGQPCETEAPRIGGALPPAFESSPLAEGSTTPTACGSSRSTSGRRRYGYTRQEFWRARSTIGGPAPRTHARLREAVAERDDSRKYGAGHDTSPRVLAVRDHANDLEFEAGCAQHGDSPRRHASPASRGSAASSRRMERVVRGRRHRATFTTYQRDHELQENHARHAWPRRDASETSQQIRSAGQERAG